MKTLQVKRKSANTEPKAKKPRCRNKKKAPGSSIHESGSKQMDQETDTAKRNDIHNILDIKDEQFDEHSDKAHISRGQLNL